MCPAVPEKIDVPSVPLWVQAMPPPSPCQTHNLEGCFCAGCFVNKSFHRIYSREFAEGPKNGQTVAWSHFPCCISESPSVLALFHWVQAGG